MTHPLSPYTPVTPVNCFVAEGCLWASLDLEEGRAFYKVTDDLQCEVEPFQSQIRDVKKMWGASLVGLASDRLTVKDNKGFSWETVVTPLPSYIPEEFEQLRNEEGWQALPETLYGDLRRFVPMKHWESGPGGGFIMGTLSATDGYRAHLIWRSSHPQASFTLPNEAMRAWPKGQTFYSLTEGRTHLRWGEGDVYFQAEQVEPLRVYPETKYGLTVDFDKLLQSVDRLRKEKSAHPATLSTQGGILQVDYDNLGAEYRGEIPVAGSLPFDIGVSPSYLYDLLKAMPDTCDTLWFGAGNFDPIVARYEEDLGPFLAEPSHKEEYIVMPMRL